MEMDSAEKLQARAELELLTWSRDFSLRRAKMERSNMRFNYGLIVFYGGFALFYAAMALLDIEHLYYLIYVGIWIGLSAMMYALGRKNQRHMQEYQDEADRTTAVIEDRAERYRQIT